MATDCASLLDTAISWRAEWEMQYAVVGGARSASWVIVGRGAGRVVRLAMRFCADGGRPA